MSPMPLSGSLLVTETSENDAAPERESETVVATFTDTSLWLGGQITAGLAAQVMVGGVRSILTLPTVADAEFPARSVHVPLTDWFAPSLARTVGAAGLPGARPERASVHWNATVTLVLFQPLAFGAGVREPAIVGGVLSILTTSVLAASMLPALSVAENVTTVVPSALIANAVEFPETTVLPIVWAPLAL